MSDLINTTEHKVTAQEVEENCPTELLHIAKNIRAHLDSARKCEEKADQHYTSVGQHLVRAQEVCDEGGFNAFREKFCPKLGQSRAYELLSIATNKKSIEDIRAATRERVTKHRERKAADSVTVTEKLAEPHVERTAPADSVTVTETRTPAPQVEADHVESANTTQEQTREPPIRRSARDEAVYDFSARVMDLIGRTGKHKPERFAATRVSADELAKLGKFLTDLADLKKARGAELMLVGNGTETPEESAEKMKAEHAAAEIDALAA